MILVLKMYFKCSFSYVLYLHKILKNAGIKVSKDPEPQQMLCLESGLIREKLLGHLFAPVRDQHWP